MFHPWLSDMHWGVEGPFTLWITAFAVPIIAAFRVRLPSGVVALWAVSFLGLLASLGSHTPVHRLLYELLPAFRSFRGPGRLLIGTVLPLSMVAAWVLGPRGPSQGRHRIATATTLVFAGCGGILSVAHSDCWRDPFEWAPLRLTTPPLLLHAIVLAVGLAVLALLGWSLVTRSAAVRRSTMALALGLNVTRVAILFAFGMQMGAAWPLAPTEMTNAVRFIGDALLARPADPRPVVDGLRDRRGGSGRNDGSAT